jgi:CBS domain-containing protein
MVAAIATYAARRAAMPKLGELIERPALTVEAHEPLSRAAATMFENHVGSLVVVDEDNDLIGIFTERDLLRACAAGIDTHTTTVGNWMTADPITATADVEAAAALQTMIDKGFRHLPVVGPGGLLGVVSMRELSTAVQQQRMG